MNDPILSSIVERIRSVVARQHGLSVDALANVLGLDAAALRHLLESPGESIPDAFVIDVVCALVTELAIGPEWLLTGNYDPAVHRRAMMLGEDRSPTGREALREFVYERLRRLRP